MIWPLELLVETMMLSHQNKNLTISGTSTNKKTYKEKYDRLTIFLATY